MDSPPMLDCTPSAYWPLILAYVLPPVGAVLSAIALWVASQARSTSEDARVTSAVVARRSDVHSALPEHSGSPTDAQDRRKH